jgi:hypothetical protein
MGVRSLFDRRSSPLAGLICCNSAPRRRIARAWMRSAHAQSGAAARTPHCVALVLLSAASSRGHREFGMRKLRSACVHLNERTFEEVERRAQVERRPVSNLLRIIIEDAVCPPPAAGGQDGRAA